MAGLVAFLVFFLAELVSNSTIIGYLAAAPAFIGVFVLFVRASWDDILGSLFSGLLGQ